MNLHIEGMRKLGAEIDLKGGYIVAKAKRLKGAKIHFDVSSVGATGNVMMAAVLAQGTTVIENAALEPEITFLAEFLVSMGASINGIGTTTLEIQGVDALHPADIDTIPDRIEAGTFLVAAAMTGGTITLTGVNAGHLSAVIRKLEDAGCRLTSTGRHDYRRGARKGHTGGRDGCGVSGLPHGHAGTVDRAHGGGLRHGRRHRHHLRRPVQAYPGADPPWRGHRAQGKFGDHPRCRPSDGRER